MVRTLGLEMRVKLPKEREKSNILLIQVISSSV